MPQVGEDMNMNMIGLTSSFTSDHYIKNSITQSGVVVYRTGISILNPIVVSVWKIQFKKDVLGVLAVNEWKFITYVHFYLNFT